MVGIKNAVKVAEPPKKQSAKLAEKKPVVKKNTPKANADTCEKKKHAPTAYNIYMSYRIVKIGEEDKTLNYREKFQEGRCRLVCNG